jgi:hypothetical protein
MTFPSLEAALGSKFDSSAESKKKLGQTPNTFFITRGNFAAVSWTLDEPTLTLFLHNK